jgi:5-methylcytosine-specific restriction endonuclease McrA
MNGHKVVKNLLVEFWLKFGGRKNRGIGFDPIVKIEALRLLAETRVRYKKQQALELRREQFDDAKPKLHSFRRFGCCFVCGGMANDRHHIIQLQNGGINSKKNIVSLCSKCHEKIHPWMIKPK